MIKFLNSSRYFHIKKFYQLLTHVALIFILMLITIVKAQSEYIQTFYESILAKRKIIKWFLETTRTKKENAIMRGIAEVN